VNNTKEELILKFLELTYGDCKLFENDTCYFIAGVCIYYKSSKQVGWTGLAHLDLVRTFGEGRYYTQLNKWFSEKYNLEVIKTPIFN
jgi:hypothetical protein